MGTRTPSLKFALLFAGLLFLLLSLLYSAALPADFFPLDDRALVDLPQIHGALSWQSIKTIFTPGTAADYYPLRDFSYLIDKSVFNLQPMAMRWMNLFYFSISAAVLFYVFLQLSVNGLIAAGLALLWAVHPYHMESILWISARKDILAILFALFSFSFFLNARHSPHASRSLFLSAFFFLLCCFSKASFSLLPAAFFLALYWEIIPRTRSQKIYFLCLAILGCASAGICFWYYSSVNPMQSALSFSERLPIVVTALGKMVAGWYYFCANQIELDEWGEWAAQNELFFYLGLAAYALYFLALGIAIKKRREPLLILLVAIALLYLAIPSVLGAHRYAYSSRYFEPIALVLFIGLGLAARSKLNNKYILFVYVAGVACFTYARAPEWKDNISYSLHDLESEPKSITKRTAVMRDLLNAHGALSQEQSRVLLDSLNFLQSECGNIQEIHSVQDKQLSCRTYLSLAWQIQLWKKDFSKATYYLDALKKLEYKNIQSQRQLDRMNMELKLANGALTAEDISLWLRWKNHSLDEKNRLITLVALCLSGSKQEAAEKTKDWEQSLLLRETSLREFRETALDRKINIALGSCLPYPPGASP